MFAPEGFIPLPRILNLLEDVSGSAWRYESLRRSKVDDKFWRDAAGARDFLMTRSLLSAWLLAQMMDSFDVYAASPDGHVLIIDGWALEHQEQLSWYEWEWPDNPEYSGELSQPMQILREGFNPISRFLFVDVVTSTFSVKRRRAWLEAEQERTGDNLLALAAVMERLDEWAVCFKVSNLPKSTDEILEAIGFDFPRVYRGAEQVNSVRRGRPQKVPKIAEVYSSHFPDGHGTLQREEVKRAIQPHVKFGFSLDSLDKAIRAAKQS